MRISTQAKTVRLADGAVLPWDELVLAVGSTGTTFGIPGVEENALQMKTIQEARAIKHRLLQTYEEVELGRLPKDALRVVVVGGGPTGVEVSGAVAELQRAMRHEFPALHALASVTLVEAGPRLLPSFSEKSSAHAKDELEQLGVTVKVACAVDRMYPSDVHLTSGEVLAAGTIVWAAGVAAPEQWKRPRRHRSRAIGWRSHRRSSWATASGSSVTSRTARAPTAARSRWWRRWPCRWVVTSPAPSSASRAGRSSLPFRLQGQGADGDDRPSPRSGGAAQRA